MDRLHYSASLVDVRALGRRVCFRKLLKNGIMNGSYAFTCPPGVLGISPLTPLAQIALGAAICGSAPADRAAQRVLLSDCGAVDAGFGRSGQCLGRKQPLAARDTGSHPDG